MKQLILASASALALIGLAACSDSADNTTTQSTTPPPVEQPATPQATPQTGTGGDTQQPPANDAMKPAEPAPAQ